MKLPTAVLSRRLLARLEKGGLTRYGIRGSPEQHRHLLLPLADGTIGRWMPGESARDRKPWEATVKLLPSSPATVGACEYLGSIAADQIEVSDEDCWKVVER